jgi:hypothetical protein
MREDWETGHTGGMRAAVDLKHSGLIVSAGAAVALRCFSDFGFGTIQQNAAVSGLDLRSLSLSSFDALFLKTMVDELQRDWFNLAPQAPAQVCAIIAGLVGLYALLRRGLPAQTAAAIVLLITPLVPIVATAAACAWVLARASSAA